MKQRYFKFICSIVLFAISISLYSLYTFAWYTESNKAEAGGVHLEVAGENGANIVEYQIIQRDGAENTAKVIATNMTEGVEVIMSEYDTVFTDTNVNTPIVIRAVVEIPESASTLQVHIDSPISNGHWTTTDTTDGALSTYLSNIIGVHCNYIDSLKNVDVATDTDTIYNTVITTFTESTEQTFAKVTGTHNDSKVERLTFDIEEYTKVNNRIVVFIKFDYYADLIHAYIDQNGIDVSSTNSTVGNANNVIDFLYDLGAFTFTCY